MLSCQPPLFFFFFFFFWFISVVNKFTALTQAGSQHTDTSKNAMATLKCCYVLHSYVGTILAMMSSLHNSIHPPVMEINPPKTACGCPWGRVLKKKKTPDISNPLTLQNAFVNVPLHILGDPTECSAQQCYNNNKFWHVKNTPKKHLKNHHICFAWLWIGSAVKGTFPKS